MHRARGREGGELPCPLGALPPLHLQWPPAWRPSSAFVTVGDEPSPQPPLFPRVGGGAESSDPLITCIPLAPAHSELLSWAHWDSLHRHRLRVVRGVCYEHQTPLPPTLRQFQGS